ncbi:hypothetical protein DACRYDRAFT_107999 [Dacryopinax primogenitus]|uniref:Cation efflux protein n=1 Tax=Dacryopinax primogenitus (strain DJM 731) TaxID=1858805 RepID=M5FY32_DACPD|nr:uncharacterized protein DACRYDRAFT_107999 [Dacryopinax primogenitus]EJU01449.1 hypothetical protein DACRYDRAFT_107999 [Dacryopinax primogenitus]
MKIAHHDAVLELKIFPRRPAITAIPVTMHRRKPSTEDDNLTTAAPTASSSSTSLQIPGDPVESSKIGGLQSQTSIPPDISPTKMTLLSSGSTSLAPSLKPPSPLGPSFQISPPISNGNGNLSPPEHLRRHSRIHSRNLSVFFPRPGQAPSEATIAEDAGQCIEAPVTLIPTASTPPPRRLGDSFRFGEPPPPGSDDSPDGLGVPAPRGSARRGHHHKHSLSHNFFSFMEPGSIPPRGTPATPATSHLSTPSNLETPWQPVSPFPPSNSMPTFPSIDGTVLPSSSSQNLASLAAVSMADRSTLVRFLMLPNSLKQALLFALVQFGVGATLWVTGQQRESLASTGLGYWVVFDAAGVYLRVARSMTRYADPSQRTLRNPFGNLRIETVALFAQSVYLMFAAVYICKETVEHVILSSGGEQHHHHTGASDDDEFESLNFPNLLILFSSSLIILSNFIYNNHSKLVDAIGYRFPTLYNLIKSPDSPLDPLQTSGIVRFLANPFTLAPVAFGVLILLTSMLFEPEFRRSADLLLAAVETVFTFAIAYPAAVSLGKVLLQTAPVRGLPNRQMDKFDRALREVKGHPIVLHVPAPHVWQLTPPPSDPTERGPLVATVDVHVKKDTGDDDILKLTRWAWELCTEALGGEVTVSILRE